MQENIKFSLEYFRRQEQNYIKILTMPLGGHRRPTEHHEFMQENLKLSLGKA